MPHAVLCSTLAELSESFAELSGSFGAGGGIGLRSSHDITTLLKKLVGGEKEVLHELMPLVYTELKALAARHMTGERAGHSLEATGLVHETYLKLVDQKRVEWQDRAHFLGVAAQAMRRILVDHARARRRRKRGGDQQRVSLENLQPESPAVKFDHLDVDEALTELARDEPRKARVVELHYFGGLTYAQIAEILGVTDRTAKADWDYARAWLFRRLDSSPPRGS